MATRQLSAMGVMQTLREGLGAPSLIKHEAMQALYGTSGEWTDRGHVHA